MKKIYIGLTFVGITKLLLTVKMSKIKTDVQCVTITLRGRGERQKRGRGQGAGSNEHHAPTSGARLSTSPKYLCASLVIVRNSGILHNV